MTSTAGRPRVFPFPPPDGTAVEIIDEPRGLRVRLIGEADLASEYAFRLALDCAVVAVIDLDAAEADHQQLVIDTTGLTFCDVRGITVLIHTVTAGRTAGATVSVIGANAWLGRLWRFFEPKLPLAEGVTQTLLSLGPSSRTR